jgi:hypothetical protein
MLSGCILNQSLLNYSGIKMNHLHLHHMFLHKVAIIDVAHRLLHASLHMCNLMPLTQPDAPEKMDLNPFADSYVIKDLDL